MNSITTYIPKRDILGRFTPSKKTTFKTLFLVLVVTSFYLNYHLLKMTYNIKCGVNNQVVGYFTKKSTCDDLYQNWSEASLEDTEKFVANNQDLYEN